MIQREHNDLEIKRDSLKGFAKLTKKGELQSRIDYKNEEIDLLKVGLSGIVKRYGFHTVHDFYEAYTSSKEANAEYRDKADKCKEVYGENAQELKRKRIHERLQNHQQKMAESQVQQINKNKEKW